MKSLTNFALNEEYRRVKRLGAVRIGFLLCFSFRIGVEAMFGFADGLGAQLSTYYYFGNNEMIYALMLLVGFTGLFVDRVITYVGNEIIRKRVPKSNAIYFQNYYYPVMMFL